MSKRSFQLFLGQCERTRHPSSSCDGINYFLPPEALFFNLGINAHKVSWMQECHLLVVFWGESSQLRTSNDVFRLVPAGVDLDSDQARSELLQCLMDQVLEGSTSRLMNMDLKTLPERELPPGTWGSLFLLYQAKCLSEGDKCASKALFYEVSRPWRRVLKFRRQSQHSSCNLCEKYRSQMRHSKSFVSHAQAVDRLLGHLSHIWRCRSTYWESRQQSRSGDGSLLTLIIDGMDRSKPSLPRWPRGQQPKHSTFERIPRTGVLLSAVLAHGHGVVIFLAEEHASQGSSYTWDSLLFAIDLVWKNCRKTGKPFSRSRLASHSTVIHLL